MLQGLVTGTGPNLKIRQNTVKHLEKMAILRIKNIAAREVSTYGRLKMQSLYVAKCLLMEGSAYKMCPLVTT